MGTCRFSTTAIRFGSFSALMIPCLMRKSRTMGELGVLGRIQCSITVKVGYCDNRIL